MRYRNFWIQLLAAVDLNQDNVKCISILETCSSNKLCLVEIDKSLILMLKIISATKVLIDARLSVTFWVTNLVYKTSQDAKCSKL